MNDDDHQLSRRYRIDQPDGTWWELGWDRPLGTFYAQHLDCVPFDPFTADNLLDWHGTELRELPTVAALTSRMPFDIPETLADALAKDAAAFPQVADPAFLQAAERLLAGLEADGPSPMGGDAEPMRWTLAAAPLADALQRLRSDPYLAAEDLDAFADGLGLDRDLTVDIASGTREEVTVEEIAEVCEALRCSPYDIWSPDQARQILHAYGPERWPRHIEPLDEGRSVAASTDFVRRRIEQQAAEVVRLVHLDEPAETRLLVTRFQQTHVLAVDAAGRTAIVDDATRPAKPGVEYHFAFRPLAEPEFVDAPIAVSDFAGGCPPGHDAHPRLVEIANRLDRQHPGADLVRFTDPATGAQQWLGRETPFDPWQTWDDPRSYYPGDPNDVLQSDVGTPELAEPPALELSLDL